MGERSMTPPEAELMSEELFIETLGDYGRAVQGEAACYERGDQHGLDDARERIGVAQGDLISNYRDVLAALASAEKERGAVEQQLREAEAYIAALRGPLLYYFGTTHPELLAEAWKDLLGETSEDVHAERSGEIQAITFDECRLLFSLHTATEPAVLQPAPPPDSPRATVTLLLLVLGEPEANMLRREDVEAWTPEQRRAAEEWAGAVHCAASDNDVPEAELVVPEHVTALCALLAERALRAAAGGGE